MAPSTPTASIAATMSVTGDFGRAFKVTVPWAVGVVVLIGVDLDVDYGGSHGFACAGDGLSFRGSDDEILMVFHNRAPIFRRPQFPTVNPK